MENYKVYRSLKSKLHKRKVKLADLKNKSTEIKARIATLEIEIEENITGLNMVFDAIVTQKDNKPK